MIRQRPPSTPLLICLLLIQLLGAAPSHARPSAAADPVAFRFSGTRTFVGQPITAEIEVRSDGSHVAPVAPLIAGAEVTASTPSRFESTQIMNGRVSRSVTITYRFAIQPTAEGVFTIPPIKVIVEGLEYASEPQQITVLPLASDDRFLADIVAEPAKEAWVGQGVDLTLRLWIERFSDSRWGVTIPAESMWNFLEDSSRWGAFESRVRSFAQSRSRPPSRVMQRTVDGESVSYDVFEITKRVYPGRAGALDLGQIAIRMQYPIRLERGTDLFDRGSLRVTQAVPLVATPGAPALVVRALPEIARPPTFAGAVGRFEIDATTKSVDVAVGDPIELTLIIKDRTVGGADLATLSPPRLSEQAALTADFRVGGESVAGEVQGWLKSFTITIRPLREGITAIPPIEFSFFDPADGTYQEARSQAIPIKVRRGASFDLAGIVDARGDIGTSAARPPTETSAGILANETRLDRLARTQAPRLTPAIIGAVALPPTAFLALAATLLIRRRAEAAAPHRRRRSAASRAERLLRRATSAEAVRSALLGCLGDLAGRPPGTLTSEDAVNVCREAGGEDSLIRRLREALDACDLATFAPREGAGDLESLRRNALECLRQLPREHTQAAAREVT
jgi:hypothetical protein